MSQFLLKRIVILLAVLLLVNTFSYTVAMYLYSWVFPQHPDYFAVSVPAELPDTDLPPLLHVLQGYSAYLWNALHGDLGVSLRGTSVIHRITVSLPRSLLLLGLALVFAAVFGVLGGLFSVDRKRRQTNPLALTLSVGSYSLPGFYLGIVVAMQIAINLRVRGEPGEPLLPVFGYGLDEHLILPVLALALRPTGEIARLTAELLADELPKPYVRTARAKGLPWRLVILRHAFRSVAANVVVTLGNSLRYLISTLLVIEWAFNWPGIGRDMVATIFRQYGVVIVNYDPYFLIGLITVLTLVTLVASLLAHLASWAIDPRIRREAVVLEGRAV